MQKWDYITVGLLNSYGLQYKLNGDKQNQWKDHPLHEVLHDLGEQGWELVSYDGESYIFKRPKVSTGGIKPLGHGEAHGHHPAPAAEPHTPHTTDAHAHAPHPAPNRHPGQGHL